MRGGDWAVITTVARAGYSLADVRRHAAPHSGQTVQPSRSGVRVERSYMQVGQRPRSRRRAAARAGKVRATRKSQPPEATKAMRRKKSGAIDIGLPFRARWTAKAMHIVPTMTMQANQVASGSWASAGTLPHAWGESTFTRRG